MASWHHSHGWRWKRKIEVPSPLYLSHFESRPKGERPKLHYNGKRKLEASSPEWPLLMRKTPRSSTLASFTNPQRNFDAPSLMFSSKAQSKLEAKHPKHSQQWKKTQGSKAPRPQGPSFSLFFKMQIKVVQPTYLQQKWKNKLEAPSLKSSLLLEVQVEAEPCALTTKMKKKKN